MDKIKSDNGLDLIKLNSETKLIDNFDNLNSLKDFIKVDSFVIAYLDYKVLVGKYKNGELLFYNNETFELKYIQKLRVFNNNEELLIWRLNNKFKARYRIDSPGTNCFATDNNQVVFGTELEKLNDENFSLLKEERGSNIIIPFNNLNVDQVDNRIKIKTRNYIAFNEIHQATYFDSRFIGFTFGKNNNALEV